MIKVLIVVDIQNDFISGSLGVPNGKEIINPINKLVKQNWDLVVYTMDSHPINHISFLDQYDNKKIGDTKKYICPITKKEIQQELWPPHCVKGTWGEELHSDLFIKQDSIIQKKGENFNVDSYSCFINKFGEVSDLKSKLDRLNVQDVYMCGLAFDYCVGQTALDSKKLGFNTFLIEDLSKDIDTNTKNIMISKLKNVGVNIINSSKIEIKQLYLNN